MPTDRYHRLTEAAAPPAAVHEWTHGSIEVRELRAEGPYLDRAFLFTRDGQTTRVEPYRYDFWIYAPPHLIQQHMIGRLRASRLAPTILEDDRGPDPAFVVSGRIVRFEQTLGSGTAQSDVELELEVASAGQRRLLLRNTYRAVEPAADRSVDAFVQSAGRALDRIYAAFAKDLISIPGRSR
ncbi:MAG: membrane integrity-associated transporter subunit PqiC [Burkholderiales bacterium]|nr:MAG: membrane integrity-associated transporter subunit PqiC [Burkholderiales bacterium]